MKVIYVAGRYRADSWNEVFDNIMKARAAARKLWLEGWAVICPHANTFFMDGRAGNTDSIFLTGDFEIIRRCDALYMLDNWRESAGAVEEHKLAQELNLTIYYQEHSDD